MLGDTKERNYKLLPTFLYGMLRNMLRSAQECSGICSGLLRNVSGIPWIDTALLKSAERTILCWKVRRNSGKESTNPQK
jgi:hypothetical protein